MALNPYCNQNHLTPVQTKMLSCQQAKCEGFFGESEITFELWTLICYVFFFPFCIQDAVQSRTKSVFLPILRQRLHSLAFLILHNGVAMQDDYTKSFCLFIHLRNWQLYVLKYTRMNLFYQTALVCRFWQPRTKLLFRKFFFSFFSRILTTNNSV